MVRPLIVEVIDELVARHGTTTRIDLNDIAEAIGDRAISYDEVDLVINELQGRGCAVGGEPTPREMMLLGDVLKAARALRTELGRPPSVEEIAGAISQPTFVVRRAIENGGALGRETRSSGDAP
jgi:hypothetical protein